MSKQTQIALDFGQEPQAPTPDPTPSPVVTSGGEEAPVRPYMAAGGVGVRIKAYKQTPTPQTGDLFGAPPAEDLAAVAKTTEAVAAVVTEPVATEALTPVEEPVTKLEAPAARVEEPSAPAIVEEPAASVSEPALPEALQVTEPEPMVTLQEPEAV